MPRARRRKFLDDTRRGKIVYMADDDGQQPRGPKFSWIAAVGVALAGAAVAVGVAKLVRDERDEDEEDDYRYEYISPRDNPAPRIWSVAPPGTKYPCTSKILGRRTRRGALVEACATPLKPKRGKAVKRERAYALQEPNGAQVLERGSRVREMLRPPRGEIVQPEAARAGVNSQTLQRWIVESSQINEHIPSAPGLPYPARAGSSQCLPGAKVWRELEEVTEERTAMLSAELGRAPTRQEVASALLGSPEREAAAAVEQACVRQWSNLETGRKPKAPESSQRMLGQKRAGAEARGEDTTAAAYRDSLRGAESKPRPLRR
jgi:hypothetical protein